MRKNYSKPTIAKINYPSVSESALKELELLIEIIKKYNPKEKERTLRRLGWKELYSKLASNHSAVDEFLLLWKEYNRSIA